MTVEARDLANEELPHEQQAQGEKLKEMVATHQLNAVLQTAVNSAFNAGSTDPVAFMGQFLIERKDRVPIIEKVWLDCLSRVGLRLGSQELLPLPGTGGVPEHIRGGGR